MPHRDARVCVCVCVCVSPESSGSRSFSDGEDGHDVDMGSGGEDGGIAPEDSVENVISIKDLLDRKKGELTNVELKYKDVKEGKVSCRSRFFFPFVSWDISSPSERTESSQT